MRFLRRLGSIMVHPRTTMREILDAPRDRTIILLVFLASLSALLGNGNKNARGTLEQVRYQWWVILCAMIVAVLVMVLLFYFFAWVAYMAGKFLEGTGSHADVRLALAWGLSPIIFALLWRLPARLFGPAPDAGRVISDSGWWRIETSQMSGGCLAALVFGVLELTLFIWYLVVGSRTIAEAHRFSAWRGFATLCIIAITPFVITIAAVLSMR